MNPQNWIVRFYPEVDILQYPWVYHDRYEEYLPKKNPRDAMGHQRTGPMDVGRFDKLKEDIRVNGIECPFIIEYYCKDLPNAKGLRDAPVLAIRTGNNRAEALYQLKRTMAPALFVVPVEQVGKLPTGTHTWFPCDKLLQRNVNKLWKEVVRGNDEPMGEVGAWRDSVLLTDLIRSIGENQ